MNDSIDKYEIKKTKDKDGNVIKVELIEKGKSTKKSSKQKED